MVVILENKGSFSLSTAVSSSDCQAERAEQPGLPRSTPSAPRHPALKAGENPCSKFMAKGQARESQGSSPSTSTGSLCLLLSLLIFQCKREIRSSSAGISIAHPGTGAGSSSRLMDWEGKADSPNLHITLLLDLKYKMQAFFPVF